MDMCSVHMFLDHHLLPQQGQHLYSNLLHTNDLSKYISICSITLTSDTVDPALLCFRRHCFDVGRMSRLSS